MAMGLVAGTSMDVLARGLVPLLIGVAIVILARGRSPAALLGAFLGLWGGSQMLASLGFATVDDSVARSAAHAARDLWYFPAAILLAVLVLYPRPFAPFARHRWLSFVPIAAALVYLALRIGARGLFYDATEAPSQLEEGFHYAGDALVQLVLSVALIARFLRLTPGEERHDWGFIVIAGWGADFLFWSTQAFMSLYRRATGGVDISRYMFPWDSGIHSIANVAFDASSLVLFALPVAAFLQWRRAPPGDRAFERACLALCGVATALGALQAAIFLANPAGLGLSIWGVWGAVASVLILFALVRSRRFSVHVPRALAISGVVIACGVVYVCAVDVLGVALGVDGVASPVAQLLSLGAVGLVAYPFWRGGLAFARASLAGQSADERSRRISVYGAALEDVLDETPSTGSLSASSRLARLRDELGLSDHDHAIIEALLRERRAPRDAARGLELGTLFLGRYRIERALGAGGFGETWLARDERLARPVCIKTLRTQPVDPKGMAQFLREMRALAAIRHPHVVAIYDVEQVGDRAYMVMEFADRGNLHDAILARGAAPTTEVRAVAASLLSALAAVHASGLVHRDIKPSNVLFARGGEVVLADFGAAGRMRASDAGATAGPTTGSGAPRGTLRFSAPEQVRGEHGDARSDLYALGATLWELAAGHPYLPFGRKSDFEAHMLIASAEPDPRDIADPALRAWLLTLLAKDPGSRPASAEEAQRTLTN